MEAGASASDATKAIGEASVEDITKALEGMSQAALDRIKEAALGPIDKLTNMHSPAEEKLPITSFRDNSPKIIGHAPLAPRPAWLRTTGKGQANVDPLCWSLSVQQWISFIRACVATSTWTALAEAKGEYDISMHDMNDHFVKPWTKGTGCSVALLMNETEQPVELMLSHAWAGSVVETYNCLQNLVNHNKVPATTRVFFCTFSLYQPEDQVEGGLTIQEQIKQEPFAQIIASLKSQKDSHGMFVLHTTLSEVYERLWVVHEADAAEEASIKVQGLFDFYRWSMAKFCAVEHIDTRAGKCGSADDLAYIDSLVKERGGYDRLDLAIGKFRNLMKDALTKLLAQEGSKERQIEHSKDIKVNFDWIKEETVLPRGEGGMTTGSVKWAFAAQWGHGPLGVSSYPFGESASWCRALRDDEQDAKHKGASHYGCDPAHL